MEKLSSGNSGNRYKNLAKVADARLSAAFFIQLMVSNAEQNRERKASVDKGKCIHRLRHLRIPCKSRLFLIDLGWYQKQQTH